MISEGRITHCEEYLRVDFNSCNVLELCATYRALAHLCLGRQVTRALLAAGDNDPEGHRMLRDTFGDMARTAAISPDFKLALVPSTLPIQTIYREAQHALRLIGVNAWVFDTVSDAVEWLEGRTACGHLSTS